MPDDSQWSDQAQPVLDFMRLAGQDVPTTLTIPDRDTCLLRAKLILEEALETVRALGVTVQILGGDLLTSPGYEENLMYDAYSIHEPDVVEVADGCADVMVVTLGTLAAFGIPDRGLMDLVNNSNLDKFSNDCSECKAPESECRIEGSIEMACRKCGHCWQRGHHREDGKWVKPSDWEAPKIKEYIYG